MTFDDYYILLKKNLAALYDTGEASAIAALVLEHFTGKRFRPFSGEKVTDVVAEKLNMFQQELLTGKPVQYVLGEAWFLDRKFLVNESVLIPRPETEELVMWAVEKLSQQEFSQKNASIIDIGSGSGCIAISLGLMMPAARVTGADISPAALQTAMQNATNLGANINWQQFDFLDRSQWKTNEGFDLIISNPPYIPVNEIKRLERNVVDWEPHIALFTPAHDHLVFYHQLAEFALTYLNPGGLVMVEGHQDFMNEVAAIFTKKMGMCSLKHDINNNPRMALSTRV